MARHRSGGSAGSLAVNGDHAVEDHGAGLRQVRPSRHRRLSHRLTATATAAATTGSWAHQGRGPRTRSPEGHRPSQSPITLSIPGAVEHGVAEAVAADDRAGAGQRQPVHSRAAVDQSLPPAPVRNSGPRPRTSCSSRRRRRCSRHRPRSVPSPDCCRPQHRPGWRFDRVGPAEQVTVSTLPPPPKTSPPLAPSRMSSSPLPVRLFVAVLPTSVSALEPRRGSRRRRQSCRSLHLAIGRAVEVGRITAPRGSRS